MIYNKPNCVEFRITNQIKIFVRRCKRKPEFTLIKELTRRPVEDYEECSWGVAPGNAIVVSSAMNVKERQAIQIYMEKAVERYGKMAAPITQQSNFQNQNAQTGRLVQRII